MMKKISLLLIVLLLATSFVYASKNISDLNIPSDFSGQRKDGNYFIPKAYDNPRFIIAKFNETDNLFKNSSMHEAWPTNETNIFYFFNNQDSDLGAVELIEIDGKKYTVTVLYATTVKDKDYMKKAVDYLLEFNKLNNITPIAPKLK